MRFRDSIDISGGNLRRMKLRTILTIAGVVIAIGTFVAMLSFGAGNQQYVEEQFDKLGLFSTMQVFPATTHSAGDTVKPRQLDRAALDELAGIPGVRLAYPFDPFSATVTFLDSQVTERAQGLSVDAISTRFFSNFRAGTSFISDSAREAILTMDFLRQLGATEPDSIIGKTVVLAVRQPSIDSALSQVFAVGRQEIRNRIDAVEFDSLFERDYLEKLARRELNFGMQQFIKGYLGHQALVSETLTVVGVLADTGPHRRLAPILVPESIGRRLSTGAFSGDPTEIMAALTSGQIFSESETGDARTFPHVTLDLDPKVLTGPISDSVKALGFKPFSFAEQFEDIKKMFFYFDLALGVIGIIALVTASLGIINTMVMSVLERRREIGVLKSLGADENDIRFLFLVESGVIGLAGSVFGIALGWIVTRIASKIAQMFTAKEGIPDIDLFAMPLWLIASALALGIAVSVIAGYYPASRAARIDPVEALRNE